jgi:hypothetical protein
MDIYSRHRLSTLVAIHTPCFHKYRVKKGGRKEQFLMGITDNLLDDQTCSVCFKSRTTGPGPAYPDSLSTKKDLEEIDAFYKWLYRHDYA